MKILEMLEKHSMKVEKVPHSGRGYAKTESGIVRITSIEKELEADVWFHLLSINGKTIFEDDKNIILVRGTEFENSDSETINQAAADGKIDSFISKDLYREFYNLDEDSDGYSIWRYGYSSRTHRYIKQIQKNIGMERFEIEWDRNILSLENPRVISSTSNSIVEVGLDNGVWCLTETESVGENYWQTRMWFSRKPTQNTVKTALQIKRFYEAVWQQPFTEVYYCRECGKLVNWLDNPKGSLDDKLDRMAERFCGFCDNV